jgi:hypothetical protein
VVGLVLEDSRKRGTEQWPSVIGRCATHIPELSCLETIKEEQDMCGTALPHYPLHKSLEMKPSSSLLVVCICQGKIALTASLIQKCMPGKVDKDKIAWLSNLEAGLGDQGLHKFTCSVRAIDILYIAWGPFAALCIDKPLGECPSVIFGILQWSKCSVLILIDPYDESQSPAHRISSVFCVVALPIVLYDKYELLW